MLCQSHISDNAGLILCYVNPTLVIVPKFEHFFPYLRKKVKPYIFDFHNGLSLEPLSLGGNKKFSFPYGNVNPGLERNRDE